MAPEGSVGDVMAVLKSCLLPPRDTPPGFVKLPNAVAYDGVSAKKLAV